MDLSSRFPLQRLARRHFATSIIVLAALAAAALFATVLSRLG